MDILKIKQLIDVLAASDLAEIELVEGAHRVRLVRRLGAATDNTLRSLALREPAAVPQADGMALGHGPSLSEAQTPVADTQVHAPLYGIVHLTPAPGAPVFAQPGDQVHAGQTLCVLEAMKMFHEVKAERTARVIAVLVAAGDEVDAGAPLFALEPAQADV